MVDVENNDSKACLDCQEKKPLSDFHNLNGRRGGYPCCKVCRKVRGRKWYEANRDEILADKESLRKRNVKYYWKNRDKELERIASRKNRKLEVPSEPTSREVLYKRDNGICYLCGEYVPYESFNEEHIIPLMRPELGPSHTYDNLGVSCIRCNKRKGNKTPEECEWVFSLRPKALS